MVCYHIIHHIIYNKYDIKTIVIGNLIVIHKIYTT